MVISNLCYSYHGMAYDAVVVFDCFFLTFVLIDLTILCLVKLEPLVAAAVTKVEKEVDEYKEDGLKFTINEHSLDDEKDIGYDPHEGNLLRSIDNKTVRRNVLMPLG